MAVHRKSTGDTPSPARFVTHQGPVRKLSYTLHLSNILGGSGDWDKKYMILEAEKLLIFSSKNDSLKGKPSEVITFDATSACKKASPKELRDHSATSDHRIAPPIGKNNAFRLLHGHDKHGFHSFYFCTETQEEREKWISVIIVNIAVYAQTATAQESLNKRMQDFNEKYGLTPETKFEPRVTIRSEVDELKLKVATLEEQVASLEKQVITLTGILVSLTEKFAANDNTLSNDPALS